MTTMAYVNLWSLAFINLSLFVFFDQSHQEAAQIIDNNKFTGVRLPTGVRPTHYDIELVPSFGDFTFSGNVKIQLEGRGAEPANTIVLHSDELKIHDGRLDNNTLTSVTYSKATETATLKFENVINPNGTLHLNFTGTLNDKLKGFYRTSYKIGNETVHAATSKFEPTYARRCIPCWDEPAIKATFSVSLVMDAFIKVGDKQYEQVALSNMNEIARQQTGTKVEVKFAKTPVMSTYLLAFVVGPFEMIESTDGRRPVRVYTTPGKKEQGRFALEAACKSLPYFEGYFGIEYPLPKMDLIAIPDFASGAMENWGLITYRETSLLVEAGNTGIATKQHIALTVAHEIAHQWFGNLVTMEWWSDLWLNEGFASFMEYLCVDHVFPEYEIWSDFVTDDHAVAMESDSLHNSHPIEIPVEHSSEIANIFDTITYKKGSSVIRMLYTYIGDANFRKGMKEYLVKFAYKNAATKDLWASLELASKKPVRQLMSGWTAQKGYPWLEVAYAQDGDSLKLTLRQNKFSADGKVTEDEAASLWWIPISAIIGSNPADAKEICVLNNRSKEVVIGGVGDNWVKLNPSTIGLYRTVYPEAMTAKLVHAISTKSLSSMDRLGLLNDYCALCESGHVSTVNLLKFVQAFKDEDDYNVWVSIKSCLGRLDTILSNTDYMKKFYSFGRELFRNIFKKLTWTPNPNEKHSDALMRELVLSSLILFGDKQTIDVALTLYNAHLANKTIISADLREPVYMAVSAYGDDASFETLFDLYKTAELHEEKDRVADTLGFSQNDVRLKRVIEFVMTDQVRIQDKLSFLGPIAFSKPLLAWKFLQDNKDLLREMYGSSSQMTHLIEHLTGCFASEEMAQEVAIFFEKNKFPGAERAVQQSLETIRLNAGWLARDAAEVKEFLASY